MKTSSKLSQILMVMGLLFSTLTIQASQNKENKIRTEAVLYNQNWIPQVNLKEVKISSSATSKGTLVWLVKNGNSYTPAVQLKEVEIKSSGDYSKTQPVLASTVKAKKVHMLPAILHNGEYIAQVQLKDVVIKSDNNAVADVTNVEQVDAVTTEDATVSLGVRQSFDRIVNFLFDQGRSALKKILPSWVK